MKSDIGSPCRTNFELSLKARRLILLNIWGSTNYQKFQLSHAHHLSVFDLLPLFYLRVHCWLHSSFPHSEWCGLQRALKRLGPDSLLANDSFAYHIFDVSL
jgi:hypothetical protein